MKTYTQNPPSDTFTVPDIGKHYLIVILGASGLVVDLGPGHKERYKTLSIFHGGFWAAYGSTTLKDLFKRASGFGATIHEFDERKELLQFALNKK